MIIVHMFFGKEIMIMKSSAVWVKTRTHSDSANLRQTLSRILPKVIFHAKIRHLLLAAQ